MYLTVFCTCPNQQVATQIAQQLVTEQLAACVNIIPAVLSIYQWQGKIQQDNETLLMIKTKQAVFEQLRNRIEALHPYDIPEVIALDISNGNNVYLQWIEQNLGKNL